MEFERSIFRVHDKLLRGQEKKRWLNNLQRFFLCMTIYSLMNFILYHKNFVNKNDILKG